MSNSAVREAGRRWRDRQKEAFWRVVVSRQRPSALGVRAFCEGEGLKATAFYFWRREIGGATPARAGAAPGSAPGDRRCPRSSSYVLTGRGAPRLVEGGREAETL